MLWKKSPWNFWACDAKPNPDNIINMKNVQRYIWADKIKAPNNAQTLSENLTSSVITWAPASLQQQALLAWLDLTLTWPIWPRATETTPYIKTRNNALVYQLIKTSDKNILILLHIEITPFYRTCSKRSCFLQDHFLFLKKKPLQNFFRELTTEYEHNGRVSINIKEIPYFRTIK